MQITDYRKTSGSDTWHWCKSCPVYPNRGYISSSSKPTSGDLCTECMEKEKIGMCENLAK